MNTKDTVVTPRPLRDDPCNVAWLKNFLGRLFSDNQRRKCIIRHWLLTCNSYKSHCDELFHELISTLLYSAFKFSITDSYFTIFEKGSYLSILNAWLVKEELATLFTALLYRRAIFSRYERKDAGGFIAHKSIFDSELEDFISREDLVKDLVIEVIHVDIK